MRNFLPRIILVWFCTLTLTVHAATADDLANLLNAVQTMKANFTQTIYDNRGKAIQHTTGRMAMQRPGKFRWEALKPIPQLVVANQTRLWIYDPDLQQVTIRSLQKAAGETPALLLSHVNASLDKDFTITEIKKSSPTWRWFQLIPKKPDNMFESVQMGFMNKQIQQMRLQDNLGHTTVIEYKNIQTNIKLPSTVFVFAPPPNADVIDETRKR